MFEEGNAMRFWRLGWLIAICTSASAAGLPVAWGEDAGRTFQVLAERADAEYSSGEFAAAERTAIEMQKLAEGPLREQPLLLARALVFRARPCMAQGQYPEAEALYQRALEIGRKHLSPESVPWALWLDVVAELYKAQGRYAEAEPLNRRALEILEKQLPPEHRLLSGALSNLANVFLFQHRFAEAEALYKRALAVSRKYPSDRSNPRWRLLDRLASVYWRQARYPEATALFEEALDLAGKHLPSDHPDLAKGCLNLANAYADQGRYAEAESVYKRGLQILDRQSLGDHPDAAKAMEGLAIVYKNQKRYAEAEPWFERARAIAEKSLPPGHDDHVRSLANYARFVEEQGRLGEADGLYTRAIAVAERNGVISGSCEWCYWARARIAWKANRRSDAIVDLQRAMDMVEQLHRFASGGELERARFFGLFVEPFETMVAWQADTGDLAEAFRAMERCRARTLEDQMVSHGTDLLASVPEVDARILRQREQDAQQRLASLQRQRDFLAQRRDLPSDRRAWELDGLEAKLRRARRDYLEAYADLRNASPAYRLAVGRDRQPVQLDELSAWVSSQDAILLEYFVGSEDGYVLVIPANGTPRLEKLAVAQPQAAALGISGGPLTTVRLQEALRREDGQGVLQLLRQSGDARKTDLATARLAVLWEVLIPDQERKAILAGKHKRLIVSPDGALAQLPFETLVVRPGEAPQHLLDAGPPILYTPSATILMSLSERSAGSSGPAPEPVLTVGNCRYAPVPTGPSHDVLAQLRAPARYAGLGGGLAPLPFSEREITWVAKVFNAGAHRAAWLPGEWATERNVRAKAPGRRIVHFACHGLVDQAYGNLFGALALTPGSKADDPADDGFLTLAEVYELDLKGCELAILSACDTNVGPQQRGEGVWALSRGFLVAGARRVVASNWLVDDEAAASLVSYFCSIIAKAEAEGRTPDYAEALWKAKRWVRSQEKWKSPYYWAPFVLVGPN
jgi:CHAT domain-containing protein/Tfp pilus assembly protein PilF